MSMVEVLCDRKLFAWLAQHRGKKKHAERGKTHISLFSSLLLLSRGFPQGVARKKKLVCVHIPLYKIYSKVRKKGQQQTNKNEAFILYTNPEFSTQIQFCILYKSIVFNLDTVLYSIQIQSFQPRYSFVFYTNL